MTRAFSIVVLVLCSLCATNPASAECAWVLWVETPQGSDQWSIAPAPQSRFEAKEECQRRADDLNSFERSMARMQRATGEANDVYSCFSCTVDPRPEGALTHEGATSGPPKGK